MLVRLFTKTMIMVQYPGVFFPRHNDSEVDPASEKVGMNKQWNVVRTVVGGITGEGTRGRNSPLAFTMLFLGYLKIQQFPLHSQYLAWDYLLKGIHTFVLIYFIHDISM